MNERNHILSMNIVRSHSAIRQLDTALGFQVAITHFTVEDGGKTSTYLWITFRCICVNIPVGKLLFHRFGTKPAVSLQFYPIS